MMQSLRNRTAYVKEMGNEIVYNLVFKNAFYSLECIREGNNDKDPNNYCLAENITDDEGEAELFLKRIVKGKVFPVHIKEIAKDYFN